MVLIAIGLFLAFVVFAAIVRNQDRSRTAAALTEELVVDELGARRVMADGREEQVDWNELTEVTVLRNDRGPHGAAGGVVMLSGDETRGCLVPLDRVGDCGLIEQLDRLPRFDVHAFVAALDADPPTQTTCWSRPPGRQA